MSMSHCPTPPNIQQPNPAFARGRISKKNSKPKAAERQHETGGGRERGRGEMTRPHRDVGSGRSLPAGALVSSRLSLVINLFHHV